MNQANNRTNQPKTQASNHANFIEALKANTASIATDTANGYIDDFLVGTAKQIGSTLLNRQPTTSSSSQDQDFNFEEFLHQNERDQALRQGHQQVKTEYEQTETVIFNRRKQEVDGKIESIRIELQKLATEIVHLDQSTQAVIAQEVVDPGTYHLTFFEKLLNLISHLRKRVAESRNWAALHNQRSTTKSYYWKQANNKVGGTKFMLSQERTLATQTG